ncbi:MAG: hypothetical protein FWF86_08130 [Clostridia bacterium]|nr:hypothetical protein [Clostridia bacterium]
MRIAKTPEEAGELQKPAPEEERAAMRRGFGAAVNDYMNSFAKERGYDSMASAVSYAGDEDPQFALEGEYCKTMRSRIYRAAGDILDAVLAGSRPMPTRKEVFAELPALSWPDEANAEIRHSNFRAE